MGSMHTGLEDHPWDIDKLAAFFEERARGGRRPDHHRRLRADQARLAQAVRLRDDQPAPREAARADHRRRARRGRRDRAAGPARRPLRLPPALAERVGQEVADHARSSRAPCRARRSTTPRPPSPRASRWPARPATTRVEIMGSEGYLINQFLAARTNDRDDQWGGSPARRMHFPVEVVRRTRELVGDGLPDRLPDLPARPRRGRPDLGGDRRARAAPAGRRRHRLQHRHRLARGAGADDHHAGAARRLALVHRAAQARSSTSRSARPTGSTPPSSPRTSWPPARPTWSRWRGRCWPTRPSSPRRWTSAPTRSTPASPATRPASTTSSATSAPPAWSTRAPATRPSCVLMPTLRKADRRGGRRRPGRPRRRHVGGRARLRGDALREVARARRPVPPGDGGPRQGGLRRHPALLHPSPRGPRRRRTPLDGGDRRRPRRLRPGGRRDRRHPAAPGDRRHRPPERGVVRRRAERRGRPGQAGRGDRRGRHRRRRERLPHARGARTSTTGWPTGASATRR